MSVIRFLLPVLLLLSNPASAQIVTCRVSARFNCVAETGCAGTHSRVWTAWNVIDLSDATYSRCDVGGCDKYEANLTRGGEFIVIDITGRGIMAKLDVNLATFLEIATTATQALVSFGTCQGGGGG
jgi:hypothetical protein